MWGAGILVTLFVVMASVVAQTTAPSTPDLLRQHYDAAQNAQSAGHLDEAAVDYQAFLALRGLGNRRAQADDFARTSELFEQAFVLSPHDSSLRLDYAESRRSAADLGNAESDAGRVLQAEPHKARAHFALGRILLQREETQKAVEQLSRRRRRKTLLSNMATCWELRISLAGAGGL